MSAVPTLRQTDPVRVDVAVVTAEHISLSRRMTVKQAAHVVIDSCIAQVMGNRLGVMLGSDPESVHQMRVGLRRLRSALALFRDVVSLREGLREELAWLGAQLGAARDWDVLARSTLPAVSTLAPADIGFAALLLAAAGMAGERHVLAVEALASDRFSALAGELECWPRYVQPQPVDGPPLRCVADRLLACCDKRLRRRGRELAVADADARHRMRVAAKKVRYASEFLESLYPAWRTKRYIEALTALQDSLGSLNDMVVGDRLLREMLDARPELAPAIGYTRGYLAAAALREERRLKKRWKRFTELKPFVRRASMQ